MADEPHKTTPPCSWCGDPREGQPPSVFGARFWSADCEPLCEPCWEKEYGEAFCAEYGRVKEAASDGG